MNKQLKPRDIRVLDWLKYHNGITVRECIKYLASTELRKTISDLRDMGYKITWIWEVKENKYGEISRYKRYFVTARKGRKNAEAV